VDSAKLSSRLHEILKGGRLPAADRPTGPAPFGRDGETPFERGVGDRLTGPGHLTVGGERFSRPDQHAADVLGGSVVEDRDGPFVVVDREHDASRWYGTHPIYQYAEALEEHARGLELLAGGWPDRPGDKPPRLLFFDLETTGLSGGAGTYAFLVGCGYFEGQAFHTRQFFLPDYDRERPLLSAVAGLVGAFGGIVTYNGRAFDLPLIETRYQFNRLDSPFGGFPHLDMLHPSRRLWRRRHALADEVASARRSGAALLAAAEATSCALKALEQSVLGTERERDVPGFEIPSRYFEYIRTGNARTLEGVFEHNRLDLLSLAALTSVVLRLVGLGPDAARTSRERLALGRLYELAGDMGRAERCFEHLAGCGPDEPGWCRDDARVKAEALRWLAIRYRRARRYREAAEAWQGILDLGLDPSPLVGEASEALAIHHEHRSRDFQAARTFALRALEVGPDPRSERELQHRLDRLRRKMRV
jgi:uncharacterized protein YprB with RNaseH-like and TPR domain